MFLNWSIISKQSFMGRCQLHVMQRFEMLFRSKIRQQWYTQTQDLWMKLAVHHQPALTKLGRFKFPAQRKRTDFLKQLRAAEATICGWNYNTVRCHAELEANTSHCPRVKVFTLWINPEGQHSYQASDYWQGVQTESRKISSSFYPVCWHKAAQLLTHNLRMGEYTHIANASIYSFINDALVCIL